jgi:hypothetical protein
MSRAVLELRCRERIGSRWCLHLRSSVGPGERAKTSPRPSLSRQGPRRSIPFRSLVADSTPSSQWPAVRAAGEHFPELHAQSMTCPVSTPQKQEPKPSRIAAQSTCSARRAGSMAGHQRIRIDVPSSRWASAATSSRARDFRRDVTDSNGSVSNHGA